MRELLKRINVAKMCSSTNLNVIRIRNYINGKVAHLSRIRQITRLPEKVSPPDRGGES